MKPDKTTRNWHKKIIADAERTLGRDLTKIENHFITSRGGLVALEMIHDTIKASNKEEIEAYLKTTFVKRHFNAIELLLQSQSDICQTQLPDYDIGMNREFFVREVLRTHLPPACSITSGSICDQNHDPSGQVDIILLHPLSPRISIGVSDCCLSEGVFSAIEVKSRLRKDHFQKSVQNLAKISALSREYVYSDMRGATSSSEAYHFNTIGTVLFGFKGYSPEKCIEALHRCLGQE